MGNKRGSGAKNRGREGVNASGPQQQNVRGSGAGSNRALQENDGSNKADKQPVKTQVSPPLPSSSPSNTNEPVQEQPTNLPSRPPTQTKKSIPPRNLRYPVNEEIHNTTDYLKIDIVEYRPVAKNNSNNSNGSLVSSPGSRRANGKNILHSIICLLYTSPSPRD